ncbi:Fe-S cluster assembly protein SufD [Dyella nitratireducens]|uniref:Fe-S cluster assembly protein SufD n=1 Tax=Dyella nitratireducens TaxID=1849580 RepID=A0ABQ1G136_9GAMM|nr:Fe-S cluster assembly protein SufD [Dyella nitratireducens]GGA35366.1 Fe-S cluster assembly protein SufD [Dyella nitratireducens]GLQ40993.1 Fe-S cluster assembly protein SufD [Dyella nitratireducens]
MSQSPASVPFIDALREASSLRLPGSGLAWLDTARRENLEAFIAAGLPDTRAEAWKYTALRALAQRRFALGDSAAATHPVDSYALALPGMDGPRLVFVNGVFRADLSKLEALPPGLSLQPLSKVLQNDPEPLRFALSRHYREAGDAFARLNAALAGDGVVLRVAAGARIGKPIHLCFVGTPAQTDVAWHVRNVIELGEGAELDLVEHHLATAQHKHLGTLVSEIMVRDGAKLQHTLLQNSGDESTLIRRGSVHLGAKSQAMLHVLELGGALVRHDLHAELRGDEARFDTRGVFVLRGRQHIDTQLSINHQALNTASESIWRGVADERARGVFRGAIVVAQGADGSDASLNNKNLLLSPLAEIDTKPELEIYADEVKAAHGATVGQLDERALFYLRSRGLPQAEARALLTAAFCRAVFTALPNETLRDHFSNALLAHLP